MNNKETLERAYELGAEYEARATNCCQSTIAAIQDAIGCKNDDIFKAGSKIFPEALGAVLKELVGL